MVQKFPENTLFVSASGKNLLFFLWSLQRAGHQVHACIEWSRSSCLQGPFLSVMKCNFPVSSGDEKEVLYSDPLGGRAAS